MTRTAVLRAIEFRGIIEGCADHKWLLTDALYDAGQTPPAGSSPRWVVYSELDDPTSRPASDEGYRSHYAVRDLEEGWTVSASSAPALARRLRERFAETGGS